MSHNIEHYSYPENCDRAKVKAEIDHAKRKHMKIRYFTEELEETT